MAVFDMRDRLIELLCAGTLKTEICTTETHLECESCRGDCGYCTILADHLLANGVILPPCNVGDTVYYIEMCCTAEDFGKLYITHGKVKQCSFNERGKWLLLIDGARLRWCSMGTVAFLTREEAEKALREKENG